MSSLSQGRAQENARGQKERRGWKIKNMLRARKWELVGDYSVEIWFRIAKDEDGYPESKNWEQLLARPVLERDDYFQIESIPFYLKNVSRADIVRADIVEDKEIQEGEIFQFGEVIDRGGHNT